MLRRNKSQFLIKTFWNSKKLKRVSLRTKQNSSPKFLSSRTVKQQRFMRRRVSMFDKLFFFMSPSANLSMEAYKLFSVLEMQLSAVLIRAQIVPFFFIIPDLCFYRLVFLNGRSSSNPHVITSLFDVIQLPIFLYQLLNYRQNRFYYYPHFIRVFFKTYWGQFIDYTSDKLWLVSNVIMSKSVAQVLTFAPANIILYMSPFRRFSKIYYRAQPERLRGEDASLMYTHTVFKLKLFNYILFYR